MPMHSFETMVDFVVRVSIFFTLSCPLRIKYKFPSETIIETLRLFQNLSCTSDISIELSSAASNSNILIPLVEYNLIGEICSRYTSIFSDSAHFMNSKINSTFKYSTACTVKISTQTEQILTNKRKNPLDIIFKATEFHSLTSSIFPSDWDSIKDSTNINPTFFLVFVLLQETLSFNKPLLVTLPSIMHSYKLLVIFSNQQPYTNPLPSKISKFSVKQSIYVGCYTCEKPTCSRTWVHMTHLEIVSRTVVLIPIRNLHVHENFKNVFYGKEGDNWKLNSMGIRLKEKVKHPECEASLLGSAQPEPFSYEIEEICKMQFFLSWQNSSISILNIVKGYFGNSNWNGFLVLGDKGHQKYSKKHHMAFGSRTAGIRFAVILGPGESVRRMRAQKTDIAELILSPFDESTRSFMALTVVLITVLLAVSKRFQQNISWSLWVYSVMLEQGDGHLRKLRNPHNVIIILSWMSGTIILRNFYLSTMISHLTMTPDPKNIPKTMKELVNQIPSKGLVVPFTNRAALGELIEGLNSFRLARNISNKISNISKEEKIARKLIVSVDEVAMDMNNVEFVKRALAGTEITCEKYNENWGQVKKHTCQTSGRFAMLYNIHLLDELDCIHCEKPLLEIFAKKRLIENLNEPAFLSKPVIWGAKKNFFFNQKFEHYLAVLDESGIALKFEKGYMDMRRHKLLRDVNLDGKFQNTWNMYTYSKQTEAGLIVPSEDLLDQYAKLEDFFVVFKLYNYMIVGSYLAMFVELFIKLMKKSNTNTFSNFRVRQWTS